MIIGHKTIVDDLKSLAANGKLSHGYIFHGPSMVGKRTVALALAHFLEKGIFKPLTGSEVLQDAKLIDFAYMQYLDPKRSDSIGIDAVREIKNFLWQKPNVSTKRTLIIDEAELLTTEAQNALLKVTEEPPASSLLIVIASDPDGIIPTILSRLQKVYFGAVPEAAVAEWLEKGGVVDTEDAGGTAGKKPVTKAEAAALAKKALGKPGLASRLLRDEAFGKTLELAEWFLKIAPAGRRDFIKELLAPDDFSLRKFLDAVIIVLAWEKPSKTRTILWHKTLTLYGNIMNFSLNPRLQLENLFINAQANI